MKLFHRIILSLFALLCFDGMTSAHEALLNIAPGWNLPSGYLHFAGFNSFYFKNEMIRKPVEVKRTESFHHIQSGFLAAYAISPRLEIEYKQFLYQDHHRDEPNYNLPDDALLRIKYAGLEPFQSKFKIGLSLTSRLPLAKQHNAVMEPFTANRLALAITSHFSYAPDLLLPESVFNMHFNLGYVNFINTGETVTGTSGQSAETLAPTQAVQYGTALVFPFNSFTFSFEIFGQAFTEKPPETAFGRENFLYFSPAVTFPLFSNLNLRFGADLRMSSNQNFDFTTEKDGLATTLELATYPAWRLTAGLNFEFPLQEPAGLNAIAPFMIPDSTAEQVNATDSTQTEKKLYEDDATRRTRIKRELTAKELEKLKNDRIERDRALDALRKKIETDDLKQKPKKTDKKNGEKE